MHVSRFSSIALSLISLTHPKSSRSAVGDYAQWVDRQIYGPDIPSLSEPIYRLDIDACHANATGSIFGNQAINEYQFHLEIHSVLFSWEKAQDDLAEYLSEDLVALGYEMKVVNATMNGNTGQGVDAVGIENCFDADDQRVSQFMVTDDLSRRRRQFGPMPEGCPNFMNETVSNVSAGCLDDEVVDTSGCDPDLKELYRNNYAKIESWYVTLKLRFDEIMYQAKLRYSGVVGIGFLDCTLGKLIRGEPFIQCLAEKLTDACQKELECIERQITREAADYGDIVRTVDDLCGVFTEEALGCTKCVAPSSSPSTSTPSSTSAPTSLTPAILPSVSPSTAFRPTFQPSHEPYSQPSFKPSLEGASQPSLEPPLEPSHSFETEIPSHQVPSMSSPSSVTSAPADSSAGRLTSCSK